MAGDVSFKIAPRWAGTTVPRELWPATTRLLRRGGAKAVAISQRLCPVDEGDLVTTIRFEVEQTPDGPQGRLVAGGQPGGATGKFVDYAEYPELGTGMGPEQPYLRPALVQAGRMGAWNG